MFTLLRLYRVLYAWPLAPVVECHSVLRTPADFLHGVRQRLRADCWRLLQALWEQAATSALVSVTRMGAYDTHHSIMLSAHLTIPCEDLFQSTTAGVLSQL